LGIALGVAFCKATPVAFGKAGASVEDDAGIAGVDAAFSKAAPIGCDGLVSAFGDGGADFAFSQSESPALAVVNEANKDLIKP
jgi:hypothetical protein